jgi:hypothetical protein
MLRKQYSVYLPEEDVYRCPALGDCPGRLEWLNRQSEYVANTSFSPDHTRGVSRWLQLAPQSRHLHVDATIENVFMNSGRAQQLLTRKRSLWRFEKS